MPKSKEQPILTVDALIENEEGKILLIKRGVPPFKGKWCLPGGKVEPGERVEAALEREIIEEIGVRIGIRELAGVYSEPDRDPRGHYVTVAFHATMIGGEPSTSDEADDIRWVSRTDDDITMGFDHAKILQDWWSRKEDKGSTVPMDRNSEKASPRMRRHPVDPQVEQVEDEQMEGRRLVEDEAGRGKRAVKRGANAGAAKERINSTSAVRMSGSGTKRTAAAGKATAKKNTRKG